MFTFGKQSTRKGFLFGAIAVLVLLLGLGAGYVTANYMEQGGARWVIGGELDVISGGELDIEDGGSFKIGGTTVLTMLSDDTVYAIDGPNSIWAAANSLVAEGATADDNEITVSFEDPDADCTVTVPAETGFTMLSNDTVYGVDDANSIWGTANGLVAEGAAADDNETTVSFAEPTADRTITLPDHTGGVPLILVQADCESGTHSDTSYNDVNEATITLPAGWFSAGKSLRVTLAGAVAADTDRIHFALYVEDAVQCELITTDAEGAIGEFIAEWIIYATSTTAQRIIGTLHADNGVQTVVVYDADTQAFTSEGTIKVQVKIDDAGDIVTANYCLIEHWVK